MFADEQNFSELSRRFASIAAEAMGASESQALIREMLNRERLAKVKLLRRASNDCVEISSGDDMVLVRDTTNRDGGTLAFSAQAWKQFTASLR